MGVELKKDLAKILIDYNIILYEADGEVSGSKLLEQIYERLDRESFVNMMTEILKKEEKGERLF